MLSRLGVDPSIGGSGIGRATTPTTHAKRTHARAKRAAAQHRHSSLVHAVRERTVARWEAKANHEATRAAAAERAARARMWLAPLLALAWLQVKTE